MSTITMTFHNATQAGHALAAGGTLASAHDTEDQQVLFEIADLPADYAQRHARGEILVSALVAERAIDRCVQIVRQAIRMRRLTAGRPS